jgi:glycosyltransferase involved in cell wall biosynthesis
MHPNKGIDIAIAAARKAHCRLVIAAKMREPAEHAYYHQVIKPLLDDQVTYIGEVDHTEKIALLQRADALLNPIQWAEPFGLVMIEALACGTPVIATPNGAAPEIVIPGINGWPANTIDTLAAAITQINQINQRRCRRHAVTHFSMQTMATNHEHLYHQLLTHHPGSVRNASCKL